MTATETRLADMRRRYLHYMNTAKELAKEIYNLNREVNSGAPEFRCWGCDKNLEGKSYVTMLDGSFLCNRCASNKRKMP